MSRVKLSIPKELRSAIIMQEMTWFSTALKQGEVGDTFCAFGCQFVVLAVKKLPLSVVLEHFEQEGVKSKEEFLAMWNRNTFGGFKPEFEVYVHQFKKVDCHDCLLVKVDEESGGDVDGCLRSDIIEELVQQHNCDCSNGKPKPITLDELECEEGYNDKGFVMVHLQDELDSMIHPFCRRCVNFEGCTNDEKKFSTTYAVKYLNMYDTTGKGTDFCESFTSKSEEVLDKAFKDHSDVSYTAREKAYKECRREIFKEIKTIEEVQRH